MPRTAARRRSRSAGNWPQRPMPARPPMTRAISNWFAAAARGTEASRACRAVHRPVTKAQALRYGENPHQKAAFYVEPAHRRGSIATARQIKARNSPTTTSPTPTPRSNASRSSPTSPPASSSSTPTRAASPRRDSLLAAYDAPSRRTRNRRSAASSPSTAPLDAATAKEIVDRQFVEVIIAPESPGGRGIVAAKKNVRLLACGAGLRDAQRRARLEEGHGRPAGAGRRSRRSTTELKVVTKRAADRRPKWPTCCSPGRSPST